MIKGLSLNKNSHFVVKGRGGRHLTRRRPTRRLAPLLYSLARCSPRSRWNMTPGTKTCWVASATCWVTRWRCSTRTSRSLARTWKLSRSIRPTRRRRSVSSHKCRHSNGRWSPGRNKLTWVDFQSLSNTCLLWFLSFKVSTHLICFIHLWFVLCETCITFYTLREESNILIYFVFWLEIIWLNTSHS